MKDYVQAVGDAFKKARSEQSLTLEAVAEKSGVDVRTVINIEQYLLSGILSGPKPCHIQAN